jgi:hypothetical protein
MSGIEQSLDNPATHHTETDESNIRHKEIQERLIYSTPFGLSVLQHCIRGAANG